MKGIHLIALLASWIVITASKSPFIFDDDTCPAVDPCPPKLIAVKEDCSKYHECQNGQKLLRSCAANLYFSKKWLGCVSRELSDCPIDNGCPAVDPCPPVLISHETDCSKYYECQNGQRLLRSCAAGLYFSKRWQGCVSWEISDCPDTPSTTTPTTPLTTPSTTPRGDCVDGDLIEHECKCEKFYECVNGARALRECPDGEIFNPTTKSCQPGNKNDCKLDPPPGCTVGTNKPHECKCKKYYTCINTPDGGQWALRECADGWHFDNTTLTCIEGADCNPPKRLCNNGDKKKHDCYKYCNKYYECDNEEWIIKDCPNNLHFSEKLKKCTNPIEAGCDPTIIPNPCPVPTPKKWNHECDCRLYYQCVNGRKKLYECNWGSYYDRINLKCDIAGNVKDCRNSWDNDWLPR